MLENIITLNGCKYNNNNNLFSQSYNSLLLYYLSKNVGPSSRIGVSPWYLSGSLDLEERSL